MYLFITYSPFLLSPYGDVSRTGTIPLERMISIPHVDKPKLMAAFAGPFGSPLVRKEKV